MLSVVTKLNCLYPLMSGPWSRCVQMSRQRAAKMMRFTLLCLVISVQSASEAFDLHDSLKVMFTFTIKWITFTSCLVQWQMLTLQASEGVKNNLYIIINNMNNVIFSGPLEPQARWEIRTVLTQQPTHQWCVNLVLLCYLIDLVQV